jgi:hypothetical protein
MRDTISVFKEICFLTTMRVEKKQSNILTGNKTIGDFKICFAFERTAYEALLVDSGTRQRCFEHCGSFCFLLFCFFFFFLVGLRASCLQSSVLYHLSYISSPFCSGYFRDGVS